MTKRTIIIILGALLLLLIIALGWWWFLSWSEGEQGPREGFGTGENRTVGEGSDTQTNIGTQLNGTESLDGNTTNVNLGTIGGSDPRGGSGTTGSAGRPNVITIGGGSTTPPGVDWLPGGPLSNFTPTPTNQLNDGTIGGEVSLLGTPPQPKSPTDLTTALTVTGVGTALCTAGLLPGAIAGLVPRGMPVWEPVVGGAVVNDVIRENFLNCVARTIARAALQQITASTVNWINSGFDGKPSFIQNYQQFFTNVADQAAGTYIQGSALSFLCSPIQNKVRIALAQSYANRNAASCTLSRVSSNIQNFMNGNFNAGGWAGLLEFTTVPTNNPFGAYTYAQVGLSNTQALAQQDAQRRISPGGFLSKEECKPNQITGRQECKIVTPGQTIENSLSQTLGVSQRTLELAGVSGSFDTIISALLQQLMLRGLQGGVSNLSTGLGGYEGNFLTSEQKQAQKEGNELLTTLQGISNTAGQYGAAAQGAITDIQSTQTRLQELVNCYEKKNENTQATTTAAKIAALEQRVAFYNGRITRSNEVIAALQNFQSRLLQATTPGQISAVKKDVDAAAANGTLISTADVTTAQQDRTTLQAELATENQQTAAALQQCQGS